jgi:hypothetical protein
MTITFFDIVGHLSFGLTALSFLMRDILLLRILSIVSGVLGIGYNFFLPEGPLWLVIFWLFVFLLINLARIVMLYLERRGVSFTDEERELYQTLFRNFAPVEFMKVMRLAHWRDSTEGELLATENSPLDELKLIFNGEVAVERQGHEIARAKDGTFIGEMSYIRGGDATATVRTVRPTRYLSWPQDELRKLLKRNPTMDVAMGTVFHMDLTQKLAAQSGAPEPTG